MSKKCKIVYEIIKAGLSPKIELLEEIKGKCLVDLYLKTCEREAFWVATLNPIGNELNCLRRRGTKIAHSQSKRRENEFKKVKTPEEANRAIGYYKSKINAQDSLLIEYDKIIKERDARIAQLEAKISALEQNKPIPPDSKETPVKPIIVEDGGKPVRIDGESVLDYAFRVNEWKKNQKHY
jgi:hypothetical protein